MMRYNLTYQQQLPIPNSKSMEQITQCHADNDMLSASSNIPPAIKLCYEHH